MQWKLAQMETLLCLHTTVSSFLTLLGCPPNFWNYLVSVLDNSMSSYCNGLSPVEIRLQLILFPWKSGEVFLNFHPLLAAYMFVWCIYEVIILQDNSTAFFRTPHVVIIFKFVTSRI